MKRINLATLQQKHHFRYMWAVKDWISLHLYDNLLRALVLQKSLISIHVPVNSKYTVSILLTLKAPPKFTADNAFNVVSLLKELK